MELLQDACLAFFCAIGMATLIWWCAKAVFDPPKSTGSGVRLLLDVTGDAPHLESQLWALRHALPKATIVVEDVGLTPQGRTLAQQLCAQTDNTVLLSAVKGE